MRKALTMDVEKKSVIPLPAPVSMLSWMMVAWMTVLILALVLQSLYPPVSITHNIADAAYLLPFSGSHGRDGLLERWGSGQANLSPIYCLRWPDNTSKLTLIVG